jgi:hypothetical protein
MTTLLIISLTLNVLLIGPATLQVIEIWWMKDF